MIQEIPLIPNRIVAEVSKNWPIEAGPLGRQLLCQRFEAVITTNRKRGFELESWQFQTVKAGRGFIETIIAVFVQRPS